MGVVLEQILAPRVFSTTVGVHPIVAIFGLFAGAELFGLIGGLLAIPVSGVLQQVVEALWKRWKNRHPDQFPLESPSAQQAVLLSTERVTSGDAPVPDSRSRQGIVSFYCAQGLLAWRRWAFWLTLALEVIDLRAGWCALKLRLFAPWPIVLSMGVAGGILLYLLIVTGLRSFSR